MYKASAPIFVQFLTSLSAVLDKAASYAETKNIDPAVLLNTRLCPDMHPLVRQVREATNHAASACGRVAGSELPTFTNTEASIPELKERISKTIDFIKSLKPAQIDGTEDKEITIKFPSGAERKFTGQALLLNFCTPGERLSRRFYMGWRATTMWEQVIPGTEFAIFKEPWIDGEQPTIFPIGAKLAVDFPNGAAAGVTAIAVANDEAIIELSNGTKWKIIRVARKELGVPQVDSAGAPTTYWVVKTAVISPP